MLEKGGSTRHIQDILSHFNIKTTGLNLHGAMKKLINLPRPLDSLWQKGGFECLINVFFNKSGYMNLSYGH
jgi:hypothetical protein